MRNFSIMIFLCILCTACSSDFYGELVTKEYTMNTPYTGLDAGRAFEVTTSDEVSSVVITVGEKVVNRVEVKVIDGVLHIGFKWGTLYNGPAKAVIPTNAALRSIELSGAAVFTGDLNGQDVDIELSGASQYNGTVGAKELDIELSGASEANVVGICETDMDIDLSGASTLRAANLYAQSVEGEMSGASNAEVTCCTKLEVELSGASGLIYGTTNADCNPIVNCLTSGGSTVTRRR